jgi:hypothetical protein
MDGLSNGIYENDQSIYKVNEQFEEDRLFEINQSIRTLLNGLEKKKEVLTEQTNEDKT